MHRCVAWSGIGSLWFDSDETGSGGVCAETILKFQEGKNGFRAGDHSVIWYHLYGSFPVVLKKIVY